MSARESQNIAELRSGAGKAAAAADALQPKLRSALGVCEGALALKEPPEQ